MALEVSKKMEEKVGPPLGTWHWERRCAGRSSAGRHTQNSSWWRYKNQGSRNPFAGTARPAGPFLRTVFLPGQRIPSRKVERPQAGLECVQLESAAGSNSAHAGERGDRQVRRRSGLDEAHGGPVAGHLQNSFLPVRVILLPAALGRDSCCSVACTYINSPFLNPVAVALKWILSTRNTALKPQMNDCQRSMVSHTQNKTGAHFL